MKEQTPTPLKCSECGFENPPGMRFCGRCGATLPMLCPACGAENPPGFRFCGQCGGPLGETGQTTGSPEAVEMALTEEPPASLVEIEEIEVEEKEPVAEATLHDIVEEVAETVLDDLIEIEEETSIAETALDDLIEVVEEIDEEARQPTGETVEDSFKEQEATYLICQVCERVNPPGVTYCEVCGAVVAPMGALCPECGFLNTPGSLFCDNCAHRLGDDLL